MRDLCNTDKPLFAVLTKLTYSAYLNILWLVCSLPIVTIGASTTALFYVTLKMAEDRDDGLTRMFFKASRENFKPATKLWLILLAVGSFLAADGFVLRRMWSENIFWTLLTAVLIGAAVLYGIVLLYAFPLLARFENTTFGILKTAFLVGVRYLFCTLLMADDYFLDLRTLDASFRALSGLNAGWTVLDISDTPFVGQAGFSGRVYLGVVQNAPHPERAAAYIHYLFQR